MSENLAKTLEEAIEKALVYERKVRAVYREAVEKAKDPVGKKVFEVLANEEQGHIDYLEHKLDGLRKSGDLKPGGISTELPTKKAIEEGIKALKKKLTRTDAKAGEADLLQKALEVEIETSGFYQKMVSELPREGRDFFEPFMVIEEGHVAIVQAELDSVNNMGFWFDYQEFNLESG